MAFMKPIRFGKYLIIETLKNEPPIQEFRAVDTTGSFFSRFYKIKMLHPDFMSDQKAMHTLIFEARVSQELDHPNIVAFIDAGKMNGRPFIVQEYIWGRSLLQFFRKLRDNKKLMGHQHAAYIASEICRGLQYAHNVNLAWAGNRPIVHQNLNPRNVILAFDGSVRVIDFGVPPVNLLAGDLAGYDFRRLGYLAPEQANRLGVDLRADVFTTGTLFYEMLTGYPAFLEKTGKKVLKRIRVNSFTPPRKINATIPSQLEAIVLKAMEEEREDRHPSTLFMEKGLDKFLDAKFNDFTGEALGSLLKGLFLKEIKQEIKTLYELAKTAGKDGGKVMKTVPVILFNLVKADPRHKKSPPAPEKRSEPRVPTRHTLSNPTRPAIKRAAAVVDVEDEETILDVDYFQSRGVDKKRLFSLSPAAFSDEETRMLMDSTDPVIFEDESTILLDDDKYTFQDGNILRKEASTAQSAPARKELNPYKRSPTAYFKRVDGQLGVQPAPRQASPPQGEQLSPMAKKVIAFVGGMLLMTAIALIIIMLTSCEGRAPQQTPPQKRVDTAALEQQGLALLKKKEWRKALNHFKASVERAPRSAVLWHHLAVTCEAVGKKKAALSAYTRALKLTPDRSDTLTNRGALKGKMGDLKGALADLTRAVSIDPKSSQALYNLALAHHTLGHFVRAVVLYSRALSARPQWFEALVNRGAANVDGGNMPAALSDFTAAARLRPRSAAAWYNRGALLAKMKHYRGAIADLSRALLLDPSHLSARLSRALTHAVLGAFPEALRDLDVLIKATPRSPQVYLLRAEVHFQSGAPDRAAHDMEKSIALGGRPSADLKERLHKSWYSPRLKELRQRGEVAGASALEKKLKRLGVAPGRK